MALFKKDTTKKASASNTSSQVISALVRPRFTEKATVGTDSSVYTFVVEKNATKDQIRSHFIEKFGKVPTKVSTSILPGKARRQGKRSEVKKAFVYLKKGETIDFV